MCHLFLQVVELWHLELHFNPNFLHEHLALEQFVLQLHFMYKINKYFKYA